MHENYYFANVSERYLYLLTCLIPLSPMPVLERKTEGSSFDCTDDLYRVNCSLSQYSIRSKIKRMVSVSFLSIPSTPPRSPDTARSLILREGLEWSLIFEWPHVTDDWSLFPNRFFSPLDQSDLNGENHVCSFTCHHYLYLLDKRSLIHVS